MKLKHAAVVLTKVSVFVLSFVVPKRVKNFWQSIKDADEYSRPTTIGKPKGYKSPEERE